MLNKTSFRFLLGFAAIVLVSLGLIVVASLSEGEQQSAATIESIGE